MARNEPGGGNKDKWTDSGGEGPPELDEVLRKLQEKLRGIFGNNKGPSEPDRKSPQQKNPIGFFVMLGLLIVIWLGSGIYIVEPAERGVITRFGAYLEVTQPGPHWHLPFPIERVTIVNVDEVRSSRHKASMLTQDENIVDIELTVQSRIKDPVDFLYQDNNPDKTLQDATETVVRETIGKSKLDFILTEGRSSVAAKIREGTQALIDTQYKTGLLVTSVNMQPAKPPEQVKSAFDDAIKAREDKERSENKAHAYSNGIVPVARGNAARVLANASAYRDKVIAEAEGDASRFLAVLGEYTKAPEVTRERMYLDAMQNVLSTSSKVIVDVKNSNNIMYLPLDRMNMGSQMQNSSGITEAENDIAADSSTDNTSQHVLLRDVTRTRRGRP